MSVLDTYERKARLTPGLFGIAPVAFTIATLGLEHFPAIAMLSGFLSAAGGAYLLSMLVAIFGRSAQDKLFAKWGGSPTTKALRLSELSDNPAQRDIWRSALERLTTVELFDADGEAAAPVLADQRINAAVGQVLRLGQEGGVAAVKHENAQFGYERNMYGFRQIGRAIAASCLVIQSLAIALPIEVSTPACLIGAVVSGAFLVLWMTLPSEKRTELAGARYARQLLIATANEK